jgi:transcriptional regulator with XRE-family HTH domain
MEIGDKLKKIREIKGIKQETIASVIGVTPQGYGKIERNEVDVSLSRLTQIASALEMSLIDLITFDETLQIVSTQNNSYNEKVIICHTYHEKESIDSELEILRSKIIDIENKVISKETSHVPFSKKK